MTPPPIELSAEQLDALIVRVKLRSLLDEDYETIEAMGETIHVLSHSLDEKAASIKRLLKMIFGASTEKTEDVTKKKRKKRSVMQNRRGRKKAMAGMGRPILPGRRRSRYPMGS